MLTLTIAVCTVGRMPALHRLMEGLARQTDHRFSVLLVYNGEQPPDALVQLALGAGAALEREPRPGLSRARNTALSVCATDLVAYLDDDCVPDASWVEEVRAAFASDLGIAAVTGGTRPFDEVAGQAEAIVAQSYWMNASHSQAFVGANSDWWHQALRGEIGTGCNIIFVRHALLGIGGFDERLGRGGVISGVEEHDVMLRLLMQKWNVLHWPAARVHHRSPSSVSALRSFATETKGAALAYLLAALLAPYNRWRLLQHLALRCQRIVLRRVARCWHSSGERSDNGLPICVDWVAVWRYALRAAWRARRLPPIEHLRDGWIFKRGVI